MDEINDKEPSITTASGVPLKRLVICGLRVIIFIIFFPLVIAIFIGEWSEVFLTLVFDKLPRIPKKILSSKDMDNIKRRKQRKVDQLFGKIRSI